MNPSTIAEAPASPVRPAALENGPLRIVFVCNELPPAPAGGIGPCVLSLARQIAALGHDVAVIGVYQDRYPWAIPNVRVIPILIPSTPIWSVAKRLARNRRLALYRVLRREHQVRPIDIVEWPDYEGLFLSSIQGITDIVRNHGPSFSHRVFGLRKRAWAAEMWESRTLRRIPYWIGVSHWFTRFCEGHLGSSPRLQTVVYNPVDCDLFVPPVLPRAQNLVLYAGALSERKGAFALARAAGLFLPANPNVRLLFVGREVSGGERARIRTLAGPVASKQIDFRDPLPQPELAELMRTCTVFAMPSILESFGNVWAEAMASGTPVLGSSLTAGPEIVPDGIAGLLADPSDPEAVANALTELMKNPGLRNKLGSAGRQLALERYSLRQAARQTLDFYAQCIQVRANTNPALAGARGSL